MCEIDQITRYATVGKDLMQYLRDGGIDVVDYASFVSAESDSHVSWLDVSGPFVVTYVLDYDSLDADGLPRLTVIDDYELSESDLRLYMERDVPARGSKRHVSYVVLNLLDMTGGSAFFTPALGDRVAESLRRARHVPWIAAA
jgi:hypothetical protein